MRAIHWLITLDDINTAVCIEHKELSIKNTDLDNLIEELTVASKEVMGTCKILITIGIDVK